MANQHPEGHGSIALAEDFLAYVRANPNMRFWQALANWSGVPKIFVWGFDPQPLESRDTWDWTKKDGP